MSTPPDRCHVLYRMYDNAGALLYVGISFNFPSRLLQHMASKPWWSDIATITLEHFADRLRVEHAERLAVLSERPRYNHLRAGMREALEART